MLSVSLVCTELFLLLSVVLALHCSVNAFFSSSWLAATSFAFVRENVRTASGC